MTCSCLLMPARSHLGPEELRIEPGQDQQNPAGLLARKCYVLLRIFVVMQCYFAMND